MVASGVALRDVKLILVSHAHFDHVAGLAAMKRLTAGRRGLSRRGRALRTGIPPGEVVTA
ncbi:MBL fold metallo-hydrolase [Sphingomonas sp. MMS24-JH45]